MDKGQKRAKMAKGKMTECIASFFAILFIANVMFSGNAVARNNYVVEDLKDIMTLEDDRLVAPIIDNHWGEGLLISCSLEGSGLDLEMPKVEVSGKPAFVVTQTIEGGLSIKMLDASEEFDIDDYESEAAGRNLVILLKTQNFEQDKITILDDTPTGLAKVSRVYLPLINWPQGTEGYVYPIQLDEEGSYYVPLITGSDIRNREEISNPHSVQYTSLLPLDYTVMSCRAFECLCLKEDFINNGSLLWGE